MEYVKEVADFPNYEAALAAARGSATAAASGLEQVPTEFHRTISGVERRAGLHPRGGESPGARRTDLVAGVLTGNVLGFVRVALTAYLLGTHSRADSLAVAMGPLDTLNSVLINSMVFAFVPMLTACQRRRSARRCSSS